MSVGDVSLLHARNITSSLSFLKKPRTKDVIDRYVDVDRYIDML